MQHVLLRFVNANPASGWHEALLMARLPAWFRPRSYRASTQACLREVKRRRRPLSPHFISRGARLMYGFRSPNPFAQVAVAKNFDHIDYNTIAGRPGASIKPWHWRCGSLSTMTTRRCSGWKRLPATKLRQFTRVEFGCTIRTRTRNFSNEAGSKARHSRSLEVTALDRRRPVGSASD